MAMYMKIVRRSAQPNVWTSWTFGEARYAPGQITVAQCPRGHIAPDPDCQCGIYAVTASWRGLLILLWNGWNPDAPSTALIGVQPFGRVYTDGLVLRAERVLTFGALDWPSLLRGAMRRVPQEARLFVDVFLIARICGWSVPLLSRLRHALGLGCYSADRIRRIAEVYGNDQEWTRCPECGWRA